MLVLTRKLMEKLYIGDDVCVTVVRLEGGQVRLGIDAPRDVAVVRAELLDGREPSPRVHQETSGTPPPLSLKIRPVETRGIDIRRRGPSR
jgi:carbon storage regulator